MVGTQVSSVVYHCVLVHDAISFSSNSKERDQENFSGILHHVFVFRVTSVCSCLRNDGHTADA